MDGNPSQKPRRMKDTVKHLTRAASTVRSAVRNVISRKQYSLPHEDRDPISPNVPNAVIDTHELQEDSPGNVLRVYLGTPDSQSPHSPPRLHPPSSIPLPAESPFLPQEQIASWNEQPLNPNILYDSPSSGLALDLDPFTDLPSSRLPLYTLHPLVVSPPSVLSLTYTEGQELPSPIDMLSFAPFPQEAEGSSNDPILPWVIPHHWTSQNELHHTEPITTEMLLVILRECCRLQKLSVVVHWQRSSGSLAVPGSVYVRHLRELTLKAAVNPTPVLDAIVLPNLHRFNLEWDGCHGQGICQPDPMGSIYGVLQRSNCPLASLSLHNIFPNEVKLIECLKLKNIGGSLYELCIRSHLAVDPTTFATVLGAGRIVTERLLDNLSAQNNSGQSEPFVVCHKLRHLHFTDCTSPDGHLSRLVENRSQPLPVLETQPLSVIYSFHDAGVARERDRDELKSLEELRPWISVLKL